MKRKEEDSNVDEKNTNYLIKVDGNIMQAERIVDFRDIDSDPNFKLDDNVLNQLSYEVLDDGISNLTIFLNQFKKSIKNKLDFIKDKLEDKEIY
jgi:hypothetical protein